MIDRANPKVGFQVAKRTLNALEHHVQTPQLIRFQVGAIGFEDVYAVECLCIGKFLFVDTPSELEFTFDLRKLGNKKA